MISLIEQLKETTAFIRNEYTTVTQVGVVLGSGLGNFIAEMKVEKEISYSDIPHFPVSNVEGHSGKMVLAKWEVKKFWQWLVGFIFTKAILLSRLFIQ
jgi:purine-nucleoside phosphorylase